LSVPTALVVDDDARTRRLVGVVLRTAGFQVLEADDGEAVVSLVKTHRPDAVVLDLKMPRVSGLHALRGLRAAGEDVPVVILTGMFDEDWILNAFDAGADDYVTKPFAPRVLLARVQALLRRSRAVSTELDADRGDRAGEVSLDVHTRTARVGDHDIPLSPTEYQLLRTLMRNRGQVFTTADLLAQVWGPTYAGQDEIVRANIYRLRHKLEPVPSEPRYLHGRRGLGYYFTTTAS
jgi:DNA-binding response OmpR family regulator